MDKLGPIGAQWWMEGLCQLWYLVIFSISRMLNHQLTIGKKNAAAQKAAKNNSCTSHEKHLQHGCGLVFCDMYRPWFLSAEGDTSSPWSDQRTHMRLLGRSWTSYSVKMSSKQVPPAKTVFERRKTGAVNLEGVDLMVQRIWFGIYWFLPRKDGRLDTSAMYWNLAAPEWIG
jgi:hypothetical protein